MIGFMLMQMAMLDFGRDSSSFLTKSLMLVCSSDMENEPEIPQQVPRQQESPVQVHRSNVEGRTRVGELVADAMDELCRAFKRTLCIELDAQREQLKEVMNMSLQREHREWMWDNVRLSRCIQDLTRRSSHPGDM